MTAQLTLSMPLRALARRRDPATSHRAARRVNAAGAAERIVEELRANGPGSSHDLAERLKLSLVTVSPRMRPLQRAGRIVELDADDNCRTVWDVPR